MSKEPLTPEVGPWAKEKLERLRQYLDVYTRILLGLKASGYIKGYVYIDTFAGSGMAKERQKKTDKHTKDNMLLFEEQSKRNAEYIKGSPRVALEITQPFTKYIFIELDKNRAQELKKLKKEYSNRNIDIYEGDFNEYLQELFDKNINWNKWRGIVFLDPYGAHVPWKIVSALGKVRTLEVFINFPWMAITRLANNNSKMPKKFREMLDIYFGTNEWFDIMYEKKSDFISDKEYIKRPNAEEAVLAWYIKRLKNTFGLVSTPRPIKDTKGRLLYYLIWAGRHPKGHEVAEYILGRDDYKPQKKLL